MTRKWASQGAIFSPDKLNLVGYRNEPDIPVWNTRNGVMETTIKTPGLDCHLSDLAISADSKRLVGWASKSGIAVWDLRSGLEICTLKHSPMTRFALGSAFSPDGSLVAIGNADDTATLWNTASGRVQSIVGIEVPSFAYVLLKMESS